MYYIEFVERNEDVSPERFREVVTMSTDRWAREHPEDALVLSIGRTWRLGPRPTYMTIWRIDGFARLQEWTEEFRQTETLQKHDEFTEVATIVDAGIYEDLGDEVI